MEEFVNKFIDEHNFLKMHQNAAFGYHQFYESSNLNGNALQIKPNATFINLKRIQEIPERFLELMNLKKLQKKCNQLHKRIRRNIERENADDEDMEVKSTNER